MSFLKSKNIFFAIGYFVLCALSLSLKHKTGSEYLLTSKNLCQTLQWDTGYGFTDPQTLSCEKANNHNLSAEKDLILLKTFDRFTHVRAIKVLQPAEGEFWWANEVEKKPLRFIKSNDGYVARIEPLDQRWRWEWCLGWWLGGLIFAAGLFWLCKEIKNWLTLIVRDRYFLSGAFLIMGLCIFISNVVMTFPGLQNPFDPTGSLQIMANYKFPGHLWNPFGFLLFVMSAFFGQTWGPWIFFSVIALASSLYTFRVLNFQKHLRLSLWLMMAVILSPLVLANSVFVEKNIMCAWLSLMLLAHMYLSLQNPKHMLLVFVLSCFVISLQAYTLLFFPIFMGLSALKTKNLTFTLKWVCLYVFVVIGAKFLIGRVLHRLPQEAENYERISLLRHATDLQYDCLFPAGFFSKEIDQMANLKEVREGVARCEGRPILQETNTDYPIFEIRRQILRAILKHPEKALAARVRLFFTAVGTENRGFADWQTTPQRLPEFLEASYDFGQVQRPNWGSSLWIDSLKSWAVYPYQSGYLGLFFVITALFFWSVCPATAIVAAVYMSKLVVCFWWMPADNNFYLYDLYILTFILPLMAINERFFFKEPTT